MGFGILFIGYALAYLMTLNFLGFLFRLAGTAVMLCGVRKLCDFETKFRAAYVLLISLAVLSCGETITAVLTDYGAYAENPLLENAGNILYLLYMAGTFVFHFFFYGALRRFSHDVGVLKIYTRTVRYEIYTAVEAVLAVLTVVTQYFGFKIANAFFAATFIVFYILVFLNLALIYSCYKNICEEGDEEAPRKKSRIPFIERLIANSEKKEEEIYNKTKEYAENRIRRENAEKEQKRKNKKKKK